MSARTENRRSAFFLLLIACLLAGCGQGQNKQGALPAATSNGSAAPGETGEPTLAIDDEVEQLAKRIEEGVNAQSPATIFEAIDWQVLTDRTAAGLNAPQRFRQEFMVGMRNRGTVFDEQMARAIAGGGSLCLLRLRMKDGQPRALYRLLLPAGEGVNYLDFLFVRAPDGKVRVGDIFMYIMGEDFSQSMRRTFIAALEHEHRSLLQRLTRQESAYIKSIPKFKKMTEAVNSGDGRRALEIYRSLPPVMQQQKMTLALRMRAAQAVSDEEYLAAIEELSRNYGDDPSIHLVLIDAYTLKGQYQEVLETIDALEKALGGDPYLNVMRAGTYLAMNDLVKAREAAKKAIEQAPEMVEGPSAALTVALEDHRFDDALQLLEELADNFGLVFEDLDSEPLFTDFVASPQYKTWLEKHPPTSAQAADADAVPVE